MRKHYTITFTSDWHVGSGLGDSHRADAVLARDADGLPFLGGRAVKGALREGARRLGLCRDDLRDCESLFFGANSADRMSNKPGGIRVSTACLPEHIRSLVLAANGQNRLDLLRHMTILRKQTALENGTAKPKTLRVLECGIPFMTFHGHLDVNLHELDRQGITAGWARDYLHAVAAAVKNMGGNRSRGFGACRVRLEDQPDKVCLPPVLPKPLAGGATCSA